jgi:hypothetical protein
VRGLTILVIDDEPQIRRVVRHALEFEAAVIDAKLDRSPADQSRMPPQLHESGLGGVAAQLRWRWNSETETRPEWFSYFETRSHFSATRC